MFRIIIEEENDKVNIEIEDTVTKSRSGKLQDPEKDNFDVFTIVGFLITCLRRKYREIVQNEQKQGENKI